MFLQHSINILVQFEHELVLLFFYFQQQHMVILHPARRTPILTVQETQGLQFGRAKAGSLRTSEGYLR